LEVVDGVATVGLDRSDALNALDADVMIELGTAIGWADAHPDVAGLILYGEGRGFCAGADLAQFASLDDVFVGREASLAGQDVTNGLASLAIPTIAAIHGFAVGGGLELALACDLRIATPTARLGLPETTRGLIPGYGGTQRLPRIVGLGRATDLILTGRLVDGREAMDMGLVTRLADDPVAAARDVMATIVRNAPVAVGLAKEALHRGLDGTLSQGLEVEADLFGLVATTRDRAEGVASFLEKRDPLFEGR
jgi:enoyl-CoA hydratase